MSRPATGYGPSRRPPPRLIIAVLLTLLAFVQASAAQPAPDSRSLLPGKHVVILMSHFGHPTVERYLDTLVDTLSKRGIAASALHVEYLDLNRPMSADERRQQAAFLAMKYALIDVGLVFCASQPALNFLLNDISSVATRAPVLTWNAQVPASAFTGQRHFVTQMPRLDYRGTLQRALELFPRTERVIVIQGNSETELSRRESIRSELAPWQDVLALEHTYTLSAEEIEARLAVAPKNTIVMGVGISKDAKGQLFIPAQFIQRVLRSTKSPFFVLFDQNIELGAIGGMVSITREDAKLMADYAIGILRGTIRPAQPVTVLRTVSVPMFDWRQLEYWKANTSALPANTIFIHRPLPLWVEHKGAVIVVAISFLVLSGLIVVLLTLRRREKQTYVALQESRQQYHNLVEGTPDIITRIDTEMRFVFVNHAAKEVFGLAPDECVGRLASEFVHPEDRPATESTFQQWILGEETLSTYEDRQVGINGRVHPMAWSTRKELDGTGKVIGFASTGRDITERKQAEVERGKLQAQLIQAQKMEAIGHLAGGIAHDFNNLLQVVFCQLDRVLTEMEPSSPFYAPLKEVEKAGERAAELTRQLLAFGRRQLIQPVDCNLNALVGDTLKMLRRLLGEHLELRFRPGDNLGTVRIDKGQLEQLLMNLCINARDAMPDGGVLTLETDLAVLGARDCDRLELVPTERYVMLSVTDTGCGMDEGTKAQIFEPFFTTKEHGKGTGLGLAMVYGIIKQHGGAIEVHSEPGKGTRFEVYLPRCAEHVGENALPQVQPDASGGTETILVAEDEEAVRSVLIEILERAGYTVHPASDGEGALRVFEQHADDIDLALLDVMMPRVGGPEVMNRIRARCPRMRFLFSSGYSEGEVHTNFIIQEGLRLINKPYRKKALLTAVREVLNAPVNPPFRQA